MCGSCQSLSGWKIAGSHPDTECKDAEEREALAKAQTDSIAAKLGILSRCSVTADAGAEQQCAQHDVIGAVLLRMLGFDETVAACVEGHVLAKRYLCFKEPSYHDRLSASSKATLVFQGGPMSADEAALFEASPLFETSIAMRRWDEEAKVPGAATPSFEDFLPLVSAAITAPRCAASDTGAGHFARLRAAGSTK